MIFFLLILTSAGASLVITLGLMMFLIKLSHRFGWYDKIDERKIHTGNIPDIGGIGIFVGTLFGIFFFLILKNSYFTESLTPFYRFLPFLVAFLIIHSIGLVDDFIDIRARYKLLAQIIAAVIVAFTGNEITSVTLPWFDIVIRFGPFSYLIVILWLVGVSNALNFIDGMDGLAGGISAIGALFYAVIFLIQGSFLSVAISFALFGALCAFLLFNRHPAKIFMGDCGALLLGFMLGALPLLESSGSVPLAMAMLPVSVLLLPVYDTLMSIIRRLRRGGMVYIPDKEHTHHKLLERIPSQHTILLIMCAIASVPSASILIWVVMKNDYLFWLTIGSWLAIFALFLYLEISESARKNANNIAKKVDPETGIEPSN